MSDDLTGTMASADGPSPDADGPDSVALSRIVEIEQRRIDTRNRQAEVMLRLIAAADAADKRQYDYGVKQLESNERVAKARLSLAAYIAIGVAAAFVLFFSAVCAMWFFGSDEQAGRAQRLLIWIFTALGGGGLLLVAQRGLLRLIRVG